MKRIFLLTLCGYAFSTAFAQTGTKRITAFGDKFSISVPADVDTMSAEYMKYKYHKTPDGKSYFFCDKNAEFSIVIAPMQDGTKEEDLIKHKEEFFNSFTAKGYKLEESDVKKINGHSVVVVSFYSDVPGGKIFNRRFFAVAGNKLVQVTYNSFGDDMEKRKLQIEQSINSVIIK